MKIFEIITERKTKLQKIIINYPDKKDFQFLKSLQGSIYYSNTKIFKMMCNQNNLNTLKQNGYKLYEEKPISIKEIQITNNYLDCFILNDNSKYALMKKYTFLDTSNCLVNGFYNAKRIKIIYFFKLQEDFIKIPIGFIRDYYDYNIIEKRKKKKFRFTDEEIKNCLGYLQLYDVQIEAVKKCFKYTNGIIKAPTGAGKTEIFTAFLKLSKLKTIILTTSIDLAKQTYNRILEANLDCGLVQGNNINENHKIVIATIQSSHKLKNNYECVIVDECHEVSNIHEKILSNKNLIYRYGFSGTPFVKDDFKNMLIKQFLGAIIYEIKSEILQERNIIATPYINMIKIENKKLNNLTEEKNWNILENLFIINNEERNNNILSLCKEIKTQKMILCKKIKHGKLLEKMLSDEGINCVFLKGDIKKEEREEVLKEFDLNKNNFVLIGSKILFTGINLQNIFNLFYVAGGKSNVEVLQSLGRALRSKTKTTVNIYDFYDCNNLIMEYHSKERIKLYKKEGYNNVIIKDIQK